MAAGLATLRRLTRAGSYEKLEARSRRLAEGLRERGRGGRRRAHHAHAVGGLFGFFFHPGPVENFADASQADAAALPALLRRHARARASTCAPSPFECGFVSLAHRRRDVEATLEAAAPRPAPRGPRALREAGALASMRRVSAERSP